MRRIFILFLSLALLSCEKPLTDEADEDRQENKEPLPPIEETGGNDDDGQSGQTDEDTDIHKTKIYTVDEFQNLSYWGQVWVQGYIVGSCRRNISNANFTKPFNDDTALLLADSQNETDTDKVIAVGIGSKGSKKRNELNLNSNPDNKNKQLKVYGIKNMYLNTLGMKDIDSYELID